MPGIQDISFGPTFTTDRSNGYTHALVVDLNDKAALEVHWIARSFCRCGEGDRGYDTDLERAGRHEKEEEERLSWAKG